MKLIKVSEASGPALDWLVAKCEGELDRCDYYLHESTGAFMLEHGEVSIVYSPSTKGSQGGPIIGREHINTESDGIEEWRASPHDMDSICQRKHGPTPLIAAMRCFVVSKLGGEVEVPDELA